MISDLIETQRQMDWLASYDVGASSRAIFHVFTGVNTRESSVPHDPSDFGRCYRLLKLFPEWRKNIHKISERYHHWKKLIDDWDELEKVYLRDLKIGKSDELYKMIQERIK